MKKIFANLMIMITLHLISTKNMKNEKVILDYRLNPSFLKSYMMNMV